MGLLKVGLMVVQKVVQMVVLMVASMVLQLAVWWVSHLVDPTDNHLALRRAVLMVFHLADVMVC